MLRLIIICLQVYLIKEFMPVVAVAVLDNQLQVEEAQVVLVVEEQADTLELVEVQPRRILVGVVEAEQVYLGRAEMEGPE